MALARQRRRHQGVDYWPGFVDALSTLILVIVFLLAIFMLAQYFLAREVSGRDDAMIKLNRQIAELNDLLALERASGRNREQSLAGLLATLETAQGEVSRLRGQVETGTSQANRALTVEQQLADERQLNARASAQVEILNQQIAALRRQLAAVQEALESSEARDKDSQARIADLGSRLNLALAQRVQELTRFRSDFFGRLRNVLAGRPEFRIVGDRFVVPSEVLFEPGQAQLSASGLPEIDKLAQVLIEVSREIPPDITWVLRVDGHTDNRPINSPQFPSNWELSAARAIAVVKYLSTRGIPSNRLLAAGFGEFQPIDSGDGDEARRRNRRIEFKLTER